MSRKRDWWPLWLAPCPTPWTWLNVSDPDVACWFRRLHMSVLSNWFGVNEWVVFVFGIGFWDH